jgi:hypothetical protein
MHTYTSTYFHTHASSPVPTGRHNPGQKSGSGSQKNLRVPSCSARTQPAGFLYSCVSQVRSHTLLPPVSAAKNKTETIDSLATCDQAPTHLSSLPLTTSDWPCFFPMTEGVKVVGTSTLWEGKAHSFERWMVGFCLQRVPEIHPCKFPPHLPHPGSPQPSSG